MDGQHKMTVSPCPSERDIVSRKLFNVTWRKRAVLGRITPWPFFYKRGSSPMIGVFGDCLWCVSSGY